jgi:hypothetical protein
VLNTEFTENKEILAEEGWESLGLQYWSCDVAKKYVKMYHIDKLFPCAVWDYNYNMSGVKPSESTSKHFAHCALEIGPLYFYKSLLDPKIRILFCTLWWRCGTLN